jgi:Prp8 binding protein
MDVDADAAGPPRGVPPVKRARTVDDIEQEDLLEEEHDDAKRVRTVDSLVEFEPLHSMQHMFAEGRTSSLAHPIMELTGHAALVTQVAWHPEGRILASCSKDKSVFLWNVNGSATHGSTLRGHKNAVLDCAFLLGGEQLATASADRTGCVWDITTGAKVRALVTGGHSRIVNTVAAAKRGAPLVATASDDGSVIVWDTRRRGPAHRLAPDGSALPVLAVAFGAEASTHVYSGGLDNVVRQWDLRHGTKTSAGVVSSTPSLLLQGHTDSVCGLSTSPDGASLLSFSMDGSLRAWDTRPVPAAPHRIARVFMGASQNFESVLIRPAWSADGERVACGSADRRVWAWDYESSAVEYALPGHSGVVSGVAFNPVETAVLASCGDKRIFLGELGATPS